MISKEFIIKKFTHPIYNDYSCDIATGEIYSLKNDKIKLLKQTIDKYGYLVFNVCKDGKVKQYKSHRFIWECYYNQLIGDEFEIDHIDKIKTNNYINNLRKVNSTTNLLNRFGNKEVDELPEDAIEVTKYNDHYFENLWFSPFFASLYKISEGYIFRIPFKFYDEFKQFKAQINDKNKTIVQIYLRKLIKILGYI